MIYEIGDFFAREYCKSVNGFATYDYKPMKTFYINEFECKYPFGYGLSYTNFEYSDLELNNDVVSAADTLIVSVNVLNSGKIAGKEVVEFYVTDLFGSG